MLQSSRIMNMDYSPIRKLSGYVEIAKKNNIDVLHLNIGQPDIETPTAFIEKLKNINLKTIAYTDSRGSTETINAFVTYYKSIGLDFEIDDIVLTNGGSEALLFSLLCICDVGDEVIVPSPYYSNYNNFANMANVKLVPIARNIESGYCVPSVRDFESNINSKTKAILICNPCNPTGVVYTRSELRVILELAAEHNLYVICDEVYRDFVYDNIKPFSILNLNYATDRIILVDSLSKRYSACGCRIGVLASKNRDFMNNVLKLCQSRLCIPTIEQVMASAILDVSNDYLSSIRDTYEKRRNVLLKGLQSIDGVSCSTPGGAFYVMAKLPVKDSEHFSKWLVSNFNLNGKTIMMAPASKFYGIDNTGLDEVRLSYCLDCNDLKLAVEILREGLKTYNSIYN